METLKLTRWVDASERLPPEGSIFFWKHKEEGRDGGCSLQFGIEAWEIGYSPNEWLWLEFYEPITKGEEINTLETIKLLAKFNSWRRGSEITQPEPKDIGFAIDNAIILLLSELAQPRTNKRILELESEKLNLFIEKLNLESKISDLRYTVKMLEEKDGRRQKREAKKGLAP